MTARGVPIGCGVFARNHLPGRAAAGGAAMCHRPREKADFGVPGVRPDAAETPDFASVAAFVAGGGL